MEKKMDELVDPSKVVNNVGDVQCSGACGKILPLNEGYFHRDASTESGFMSMCKVCRSEQRRARDAKRAVKALDKIERKAIALLEEQANAPSAQLAGLPHSATTFEDIVTVFGGSQGLAQHVFGQFISANRGSPTRTKIIALLLQLQLKLTEAGHATIPTDQMSDEQLKAELAKKLAIFTPPELRDVG